MNLSKNKILLLSNLLAGSFLLFLVTQTGRWVEPVWFGAVRELLTIPFLLTLVVATILSFIEIRKEEFTWRSDVFISFAFGLLVMIILIFGSLRTV